MKTSTNRPPVEPLESRIAPARIIDVGVPSDPRDTDYNESPFVDLEAAGAGDLIATAVGKGVPGIADTFYLRLSKGDVVNLFRFGGGSSTEPFLIVNAGNIIAFFTDKNLNNEVEETEITGIAMGKGASFELKAALPGDVVANLDEKGTKDLADDSLIMDLTGLVPETLIVGGVKLGSSIGGSVDEGLVFNTATETVPGAPGVQEVQDFTINTGTAAVGGTFRITYGNYTTAPLLSGASATDVQNALNALKVISDTQGVTVISNNPGEFTVTFNLTGEQTELFRVRADADLALTAIETAPGTVGTPEVQSIDIGLLAGRQGTMTFNFGGEASLPLNFDVGAVAVQAVLNSMNVIVQAGGVTVDGPVGGPFNITFVANGDQLDVFTVNAAGFTGAVVGGKILSAGNISNVDVRGAVDQILAGSAANGASFDFFPKFIDFNGLIVDTPGGNGIFSAGPSVGKAGANISNVIVNRLGVLEQGAGSIIAGDGGSGGKGGSLNQIQVLNDSDGFNLFAGQGGASGGTKPKGGAGGNVSNVFVDGVEDNFGNDLITIGAGAGGGSTSSTGGAGGQLSNIFIGFRSLNGKPLVSQTPLRDNVNLFAGDGGEGKVGGKGGVATALKVVTSAPNSLGDEIVVSAGNGGAGDSLVTGRGGVGGTITKSDFQNVDLSLGHSMVLIAGDGGVSGASGKGATGGLLQSVNVIGREFLIQAGDGSDGKAGGAGGAIKSIGFGQTAGVIPTKIVLNAGIGGNGSAGAGGKGGDVLTVGVTASDLTGFAINLGGGGNGGIGTGNRGGAGGLVKDVKVSDIDAGIGGANAIANTFFVRSGTGGDGDKGGGNAGAISLLSFSGVDLEIDVVAGDGGHALVSGPGGLGGSISSAELSAERQVVRVIGGVPTLVPVNSTVEAGQGGDGAGNKGKGGAGGGISVVNVNTAGSGFVHAGDGGGGSGNAGGKGGSINLTGLFATLGEAEMLAGDGGVFGTKPAAGGSITGKSNEQITGVFGALNLTIIAGDGTQGGSGGSIKFLGYGSTESTLVPTPRGNIQVLAGNGSESDDGRYVGAGGSISDVNGAVSSLAGSRTVIQAGEGGSTAKKGGAGGSIKNINLQRGGNVGVELTIDAGDAGDATTGANGAKGGSIDGVAVIDVLGTAVFRHVAAGDGGDGAKKGGVGGSVSNLDVRDHDIGLRSGADYGYNGLGGIFVGAGGEGAQKGLAGKVNFVTADAVGSIAAGKGVVPELVNQVSNIYLNGQNLLQQDNDAFLKSFPGGGQNDNFPGLPNTNIVYIFNGERTTPLPKDASPTAVADALNLLPSIGANGVTATALLPNGYQIIFTTTGDRAQITGEELLDVASVEVLPGELDTPLNVIELLPGSSEFQLREIQTVRIDPLLLGRVVVNFAGNATSFQNAALITPALLQGRLNLLPSVVAAGGVTVVAQPGNTNTFQITFGNPGDQPSLDFAGDNLPLGFAAETTQGTAAAREVQQFTVFPNVPAGPGGNPTAITSRFQVTFGNSTTALLASNSTAAQVQTAINALPSISAIGGVTVTQPPNTEGFTVSFNQNGDRAPLYILDELVQQGSGTQRVGVATTLVLGNPTTPTSEVQRVSASISGRFSINFNGEATSFLRAGITTAAEVEAQLNNLPSIANAGGVTVVAGPGNAFYDITFVTPDVRPQFTAVAIQVNQPVTEATKGVNIQNVREVQSIAYDPNGDFTVNFPVEFTAVETIKGSPAQGEKQVFDIAAIQAIPGAAFTLTYQGTTTPVSLNSDATALQIQTALDTIIPGVTVVDNGGGKFTVTFPALLDQPGVITGTVVAGIETSVSIDGADTPTAIQGNLEAALNAIPSVAASGGVTVEIGTGTRMNVIFNTPGNKPSFTAANDVNEQQSIAFLSDGEYELSYDSDGDPLTPPDTTARFSAATATPADLETALNALPGIPAGGVTVTGGKNNDFVITFNSPGDVFPISGIQYFSINSATTQEGDNTGSQLQEQQTVTQPQRFVLDPQTFAAANLVGGFSDSTELNGHIFKWIDTDGDGFFESGEQPIDGLVATKKYDQSLTSFTPEARFAGGEFTFAETTPGDATTSEVQSLFIKADKFTLTYLGHETKSLAGKSNASAISKALNALPSIIAAGGVSVSGGSNNFTISFLSPGARDAVLAPFFYDFNNIIL